MKNYPFNFQTLDEYSNSLPYECFNKDESELFDRLNELKNKYRFPAVENNVGSFLSFITSLKAPKVIFEMGSGYGHSAFWYLISKHQAVQNIYLTERREDLASEFHNLPWPEDFKKKLDYFQGDAYLKIKKVSNIDLLLVDGQKSDYKNFIEVNFDSLNTGCLIIIDNSYWRGSFLDQEQREKHNSAKAIFDLHEHVKLSSKIEKVFIPFKDGLTVLRKK